MNKDDVSGFEGHRRLIQMEMLYEVGLALSESLDPAQVAQELLQRAVMMVDARSAILLVRGPESDHFAVIGHAGLEQDAHSVAMMPQLERAWQRRQMVRF